MKKVGVISKNIGCVAGVTEGKGKGKFGRAGRGREKGKERLQGDHCLLHFSRSDPEPENSDGQN